MKTTRHDNKGLRKLCDHPRRAWAKCDCPWHFNFKWREKHYRFSLDKHLDTHLDSKSEAEDAAATIRIAIKAGKFGQAAPRQDMTLRQLADVYLERYVDVDRAATASEYRYSLSTICKTVVPRPAGGSAPLGEWRPDDIVTDTVNRFREIRLAQGTGGVGVNRNVRQLRALFKWGITAGYTSRTPFKLNGETVVRLPKELPRSRRLDTDEETKLLAVCSPHLHALVIAAIDSGMRQGEILSLQWKQVEGMKIEKQTVTWAPKAELFLPFGKTKTKRDRRIPISTRLKGILEMRRFDPAGQPHALDTFVFGTEIGTRLLGFGRAWHSAVLKAHGHAPAYTATKNLTPASRAALAGIGLHYHDLRREAGSRWMDGGVPLATIQRWLGHTNIAQTSTYLAGTQTSEHDAMTRYEAQQAALQRIATKAGTGGRKRPRSATGAHRKPSKTAVGSGSAIM